MSSPEFSNDPPSAPDAAANPTLASPGTPRPSFLEWLRQEVGPEGLDTDRALAAVLPLMRQVLAAHESELVAPLDGLRHLTLTEAGAIRFIPSAVLEPQKNTARVEAIQSPAADPEEAEPGSTPESALLASPEAVRLAFLPGYRSWEHVVGHHDALTDVFSLGLILASAACGLDFTIPAEVETFERHRADLIAGNPRLHPVLAAQIAQMTALNRHQRAPDLAQIISRLEHFREPAADLDIERLAGFKESGLEGKRRLIQTHLRDRLFEVSRRNRLLYFKPTQQTLDLTVASVPILTPPSQIRLDDLWFWGPDLAAAVADGTPLSLVDHLRFADAAYIAPALDKILCEARRGRAEYGFAQLRLVLCFLRWHNLKDAPEERIHSPLLLLPVELTRKKGVRDTYLLEPATTEAEVNPALRHHLRELYGLHLPESVDLKDTTLDQVHAALNAQIQSSKPGVLLHRVDRPTIERLHLQARQRLEQYRRRTKAPASNRAEPPEPRTEAAPSPEAAPSSTAPATARAPLAPRPATAAPPGRSPTPMVWDFDLCSLTLGNFNYRKMTLVRDYTNLIETEVASVAFDTVFSLAPKPVEEAPPAPLPPAEQHLVLRSDVAQAAAIARARTGASYIIHGPPGTGKSQTITNLIADYVARGRRVLFVCEKRAAIDVVFHRLRQQGLDELCCLIHDSQTDKKAFIQNLKQTYETFLAQPDHDPEVDAARATTVRAIDQQSANLRRFSEAMSQTPAPAGVAVRTLLHRLVQLCRRALELPPRTEELLPPYALWPQHGALVHQLHTALAELGQDTCLARHPLRWLSQAILAADRPIETLSQHLDRAQDLFDAIDTALELSGLPPELWDTFEEIRALLGFAARALPLAERHLLGVLHPGSAQQAFDASATQLDAHRAALNHALEQTAAWREVLSVDDTDNALAQAQAFERSLFRFLQPAFWRLQRTLHTRYDFTRHAVAPRWTKVLGDLAARHQAQAAWDTAHRDAAHRWQADDVDAFRALVQDLRTGPASGHPTVQALLAHLPGAENAGQLVTALAAVQAPFQHLDRALAEALVGHEPLDWPALGEVLTAVREQIPTVAELAPLLGELAVLPAEMLHALRHAPVPLGDWEAAMAHKSLNLVYRQDRNLHRFDGRTLARGMEQLEHHYRDWLDLNARWLRRQVRQQFLHHVQLAALPVSQLAPDQKPFKRAYAAGRRDLEHEFGKTMRYKSIRDLSAGDSGQVLRDLKPIWLMSPVSVSDTLPLDPALFDVVIFDEASQIPLEEAIPALYRAPQVIIVGDAMQLPPTTFFTSGRTDETGFFVEDEGTRVEVDLDADSFLTQAAQRLPSTLLAWHYRSRSESLISFSNAAYYHGSLCTIPDRTPGPAEQPELVVTDPAQAETHVDALLARSLSFHYLEHGVYADRRNAAEADYIARLVRGLLRRDTGLSLGVVAFSEAQQSEIESALERLAETDATFAAQLEAESVREADDVFCGLFVKNLENVQGDERDIVLLSVCYGPDARGQMQMNFGPINQRGGEKRLNVIFSRAKHHLALVSSIRHHAITNDYNDGANSLKHFLHYAESTSRGDAAQARRVLESLHPLSRKALAPRTTGDAVVDALAQALRDRGLEVALQVGQSRFRCDLAVRTRADGPFQLGILVDTDAHYANPDLLDRYLIQPGILKAFGWQVAVVLTKDWYHDPESVLRRIERQLQPDAAPAEPEPEPEPPTPIPPASAPSVLSVPSVPCAPAPPSALPQRFEFTSGSSRKFWEITQAGCECTVRFGRLGTTGQMQTKTFPDADRAAREANRLIAGKLKKGYRETPTG